jgi:hypothetical protein
MLGIRDAKGLEFSHVVLVNFFCQFKSKTENYEHKLERRKSDQTGLKQQQQREVTRQAALKWIFGSSAASTARSKLVLPKEVEVDMKVSTCKHVYSYCTSTNACVLLCMQTPLLHRCWSVQ